MKISEAGLAMLKGFEGFREHAYKDIVGVYTVGFGETMLDGRPVRAGDALPLAAATARLRARCDEHFGPAITHALRGASLTQSQFDASVSLAYNIGSAGFHGSTVASKIRLGDVIAAGAAFLLWHKAGGKSAPVLVARRQVERACFDWGVYPR